MSERELATKILADKLAVDQETARKIMNRYFAIGKKDRAVEESIRKAKELANLNPFGAKANKIAVTL